VTALKTLLNCIFWVLLRLGLISKERIRKVMSYEPPTNIPVPMCTIEQLNLRLGIWAVSVAAISVIQVAIFAKAAGAQGYIAVSGGVLVNYGEAGLKSIIDGNYGGDEMKWFKTEVIAPLNKQLDEYLRANYDWEKLGTPVLLPSDQDIDAMPSQLDQLNYKLAKYATFQVDPTAKTVNLVTLV